MQNQTVNFFDLNGPLLMTLHLSDNLCLIQDIKSSKLTVKSDLNAILNVNFDGLKPRPTMHKDREGVTHNHVENATFEALQRDEDLAKVEIGTLAVILIVTIIGNSMVLVALYAKKRNLVRNAFPRMYFFIFHLCVADLISAFFSVLPQLIWDITYRFRGNVFLCKSVKYGQILGPYLSSYILTATAIDRYRAICYPLNYHSWSAKLSKTYICYAWVISLLFSLPQTFIFTYEEVAPGVWDCWATFIQPWGDKTYIIWYSASSFLIPLACLVFTYTCICQVIWHNAALELGSHGKLISRAKINTIKQTIAVIVVYVVCSSPFIVAQLWASWDPTAFNGPWLNRIYTILVLLATLNSCSNPWIFMIFNTELRFTTRMLSSLGQKNTRSDGTSRRNSTSESSNDVYVLQKKRFPTLRCLLWKSKDSSKQSQRKQNLIKLKRCGEKMNESATTEITSLAPSDIK